MENSNQDFFRFTYPQQWSTSRQVWANSPMHRQYQEITLASLDCFDGCSLLECGCGTGELLERLSKRHLDLQVLGIDLGRASLACTREKGHSAEKEFHCAEADAVRLPLASSQFDRVLCSSVLWYVPNPYVAVREMIRVLKPGGRFVFDVRNPYHITNILAQASVLTRRALGKRVIVRSFSSSRAISQYLQTLPVSFEIAGYFVLLPTRLPLLGDKWGNWVRFSQRLSFRAGKGKGRWLAQKLLISGNKLAD